MFVACLVVECVVYFLVFQSSREGRESWLLYFVWLTVSCDFYCSVALSHSALS